MVCVKQLLEIKAKFNLSALNNDFILFELYLVTLRHNSLILLLIYNNNVQNTKKTVLQEMLKIQNS